MYPLNLTTLTPLELFTTASVLLKFLFNNFFTIELFHLSNLIRLASTFNMQSEQNYFQTKFQTASSPLHLLKEHPCNSTNHLQLRIHSISCKIFLLLFFPSLQPNYCPYQSLNHFPLLQHPLNNCSWYVIKCLQQNNSATSSSAIHTTTTFIEYIIYNKLSCNE